MYITYILHEIETIILDIKDNFYKEPDLIVELATNITKHNTIEEANKHIEELRSNLDWIKNYRIRESYKTI
jgi:hypothetical protein